MCGSFDVLEQSVEEVLIRDDIFDPDIKHLALNPSECRACDKGWSGLCSQRAGHIAWIDGLKFRIHDGVSSGFGLEYYALSSIMYGLTS